MPDVTKTYICENCESEYQIVYPISLGNPVSCPFCGENIEDPPENEQDLSNDPKEEWEDL